METLSPAYGRDYSSKEKVLADLRAGKDFVMNPSGRYCNLDDLAEEPNSTTIAVWYAKLRKVAVFKLSEIRLP